MDTDGPPERLRLIYGEALTNSSPPPLLPPNPNNANLNPAAHIILNNPGKLLVGDSNNYSNGPRHNNSTLNPHALTFIQQQQQQQQSLNLSGYSHPPGLPPIMSPGLYSNGNSHGSVNPPPGLSPVPLSPHVNAPPGFYYPPTQNPSHLYHGIHHVQNQNQQTTILQQQAFGTGALNSSATSNSNNSTLYSRPIMPVQGQPQNQNQNHNHNHQHQQFTSQYNTAGMFLQQQPQQQQLQQPNSVQSQGVSSRGSKIAGPSPAPVNAADVKVLPPPPGIGKPMIDPMIENIVGSMSMSTNGTYTHFGPITPGGLLGRRDSGSSAATVVTSGVHLPSGVIGPLASSFGSGSGDGHGQGHHGHGHGHVLAFNSVVSNSGGGLTSSVIGSGSNSKCAVGIVDGTSTSVGKMVANGSAGTGSSNNGVAVGDGKTTKRAAIVSPSLIGSSNVGLKEKLGIVHPRVIGKESPVNVTSVSGGGVNNSSGSSSTEKNPSAVSPKEGQGGSDSRPQTPGKLSYSEVLVKNEPKGTSATSAFQKAPLSSPSPIPLTVASLVRKNSLQSDFRDKSKSPSNSSSSSSSPVTKPKLSLPGGDSKYSKYKGKENSNSSSNSNSNSTSSSKSSTTKSTPNGTPTHNGNSHHGLVNNNNSTTGGFNSKSHKSMSTGKNPGNDRKVLSGSFTNGSGTGSSSNNAPSNYEGKSQVQKTSSAGNVTKNPGRTSTGGSGSGSGNNSFEFGFDIEDLDDIHEKMSGGWNTKGGKRGSASSLNSLNSLNGKTLSSSTSSIGKGDLKAPNSNSSNSNNTSTSLNNVSSGTPGNFGTGTGTGSSPNPLTVTNNLNSNNSASNGTAVTSTTTSTSGENKKTGSALLTSSSSGGGSSSSSSATTGKASVRNNREKTRSRKGDRNRMVERARLWTTIWIGHLISALNWLWTLVVNVSTLSCSLAFTLLEDLYGWWRSKAVPSVRSYYRDGIDKTWEYWEKLKSKIPWRGRSAGTDGGGGSGEGSEGTASGKYGRPRGLNSKDGDEILSMMGPERNILLPGSGEEALKRLLSVKGQDPYSILGIRSDSSDDTVRRYYKKQAVLVHPDKNVVPGAEEAFKILARAFELVGEPAKRLEYHRQLLEAHEKERVFGEIGNLLEQLRKKMESVSNTIRCTKCSSRHKKNRTDRPLFAARYCAHCRINHAAREGDLWAERKGFFGLSRQYYTCMESAVWEVNEWASCQKKNLQHLQPDCHNVMYRLVAGGGAGGNVGGGNSNPPTGPNQSQNYGGPGGKGGGGKGHSPPNSNPNNFHDDCNGTGPTTHQHQHPHFHRENIAGGGDMDDWDTLLNSLRTGAKATVNKMSNGHGHGHGSSSCAGCTGNAGNPGSTSAADGVSGGLGGNSNATTRRRGKVKRSK